MRDLAVDEQAVAASTLPVNFPSVDVYDGCVFLRFPVRVQRDAEEAAYAMILCMNDGLVSISVHQSQLMERTLQLLGSGSQLAEPSSQALLLFILDVCTDINTRQYMEARSAVEILADQIDDKPGNFNEDDLIPVRRAVGRLATQFEDQYYCMGYLHNLLTPSVPFRHLKSELRDIMDSQHYVVRSQDKLETRLRDLHNDCLFHVQRITDYRLRVLTVLTSICMPLTVISGSYGMNFKFMPELEWTYGYFIVPGFMLFLVASLLVFFFRGGWFK